MNTSDIYERVEEPQIKPGIQTAALVKAAKPEKKTFVDTGSDPIRFEEILLKSKNSDYADIESQSKDDQIITIYILLLYFI